MPVDGSLFLVDRQAVFRLIVFNVPVDIDNTFRLFEQAANLAGQCNPPVHTRAIDFGNQRLKNRRAGRNFGYFDARAITIRHGLNPNADLFGDLVALQISGSFG